MRIFLLFVLYILLCVVSLYRHYKIEPNTFRSELWADRAGYYVYLPATFLHGFSADEFPTNIEEKTGQGFRLDINNNKVQTKYTYGVALLQLPFFLLADMSTSLSNTTERDGFSLYYSKSLIFAAAFYLIIGLYLLFLSLKLYFKYSNKIIFLTLILLYFGTNLYYYSIMEVGMSHVYSFFLFSSILFLVTHQSTFKNKYYFQAILSIIAWLIVLIRPINIIFIPIIILWDVKSINQIIVNLRENIDLKVIIIWLTSFLVIFLPQFIYWKYAYGQFITYSYSGETFSNYLSPRIIEVLFAPKNGLFPYSIITIVILFGIGLLLRKKMVLGIFSGVLFILVCYATASWHDWNFGCGCGMRNIVEYYSLFSFALLFAINKIYLINNKLLKLVTISFIFIIALISFKVNYHYFGCYFGNTWEWMDYIKTFLYPLEV